MSETRGVTVITKPALSLSTIGVITWIVFMVLFYGVKPSPIAHWNVFWVWFPLWIMPAISAAIWIIALIICLIIVLVENRR